MAFLLTIRERNHSWAGRSPITTAHDNRADAEPALLDYVRRNWDADMGTDPPEDPKELIQEYFSDVLEVYEIMETTSTKVLREIPGD
jgi:hypothetical protein